MGLLKNEQPTAFDSYADAYFGLLESLEQLFGKPVDLVVGSASGILFSCSPSRIRGS